jgi:hypothetical protein
MISILEGWSFKWIGVSFFVVYLYVLVLVNFCHVGGGDARIWLGLSLALPVYVFTSIWWYSIILICYGMIKYGPVKGFGYMFSPKKELETEGKTIHMPFILLANLGVMMWLI